MREVAAALDMGFADKVLPQRPGIVNLQCDMDHPTQILADLLHLKNVAGSLEKLKGKKLAVSWAYSPSYGKPLSVPQGLIGLMTRFGMDVTLAYPEGYDLIPGIVEIAKKNAKETGGSFSLVHSMEEAFVDADFVYPKSWAPYRIMETRTELLKARDRQGLEALEKDCLAQNAHFKNWHCDEEKMKAARPEAVYMHCLPADISGVSCPQGEVSADVFDKFRNQTYRQAGYKPFIIAALMVAHRFENPFKLLTTLYKRNEPRLLRG